MMLGKTLFTNNVTEMLILFLLNRKDCYVYEIAKTLRELSGSTVDLTLNAVYTITYRMESEEKISEYTVRVGAKRTRVYYRITEKGKESLQQLLLLYQEMTGGINAILALPEEAVFGEAVKEYEEENTHTEIYSANPLPAAP